MDAERVAERERRFGIQIFSEMPEEGMYLLYGFQVIDRDEDLAIESSAGFISPQAAMNAALNWCRAREREG
jgi:hypothetical protein